MQCVYIYIYNMVRMKENKQSTDRYLYCTLHKYYITYINDKSNRENPNRKLILLSRLRNVKNTNYNYRRIKYYIIKHNIYIYISLFFFENDMSKYIDIYFSTFVHKNESMKKLFKLN